MATRDNVVRDDELTIVRHDAAGAAALADDLICVYAEIYAHKADNPFFSVERFAERFRAHSARPGYELVTGTVNETLVGYAYGLPLAAGSQWWDGLLEASPPEMVRETGSRTFALNEIMVREPWRRNGIARRLHDALMADRREERATLLVEPTNTPAKSAYVSWGWRQVGHLQPFPDAPVYDSMLLHLRAGQTAAG